MSDASFHAVGLLLVTAFCVWIGWLFADDGHE